MDGNVIETTGWVGFNAVKILIFVSGVVGKLAQLLLLLFWQYDLIIPDFKVIWLFGANTEFSSSVIKIIFFSVHLQFDFSAPINLNNLEQLNEFVKGWFVGLLNVTIRFKPESENITEINKGYEIIVGVTEGKVVGNDVGDIVGTAEGKYVGLNDGMVDGK